MTAVFNGVTNTFFYSYLKGTTLVSGMTNSAGQGWTRTYEHARNLIAMVSNSWDGTAVSSFAYENDALGRRTLRLDAAPALSATNVFAYNQRSEVTNAAMGESMYSYDYDDIGNRRWAAADSSSSTYAANNLNQYTVVTNAGISLPVGYDLDGNMTVNGDWLYDWDGENNLWLAQQAVLTNGALQVENGYDYLKRRWYKRVDVLTGYEPPSGSPPMPGEPGEFVPSKTTCYVWVGWNIAAEINIDEVVGTTNITRYVWGLDLSGSVQGAGGVGGLLAVIEDNGSVYFPCYDANGNITEYIDATGTVRAHREFDAFGNTTAKSGDLADSFRFWYSTKYLDEETGNYVYQQRQDIPSLGRWASRDPIEERGGYLLYLFVKNSPLSGIDLLGYAPQLCGIDKNGAPIYCPYPPTCYNCPEYPKSSLRKKCKDCKPEETGVVIYKTTKLPPGTKNANVHYWLAWHGGTTDANSIALWTGVYSGVVLRDAGYAPSENQPEKKKLKPCEYDFDKLHQCISEEVAIWVGREFGLCYAWTSHLWSKCSAAAKKQQ